MTETSRFFDVQGFDKRDLEVVRREEGATGGWIPPASWGSTGLISQDGTTPVHSLPILQQSCSMGDHMTNYPRKRNRHHRRRAGAARLAINQRPGMGG